MAEIWPPRLDIPQPRGADAGIIMLGGGGLEHHFNILSVVMVSIWCHLCWGVNIKVSPPLTVVSAASLCAAWDVRSLLCVLWKVSLETVVSQAANLLIFYTTLSNKFKHWGGVGVGVTSLLPPSCFPMYFSTLPHFKVTMTNCCVHDKIYRRQRGQLMKTFMGRVSSEPGVQAQQCQSHTRMMCTYSQRNSL